jgi:hypothetical protein
MKTRRKSQWLRIPNPKPGECPTKARIVFDQPPPAGTVVTVSVVFPPPQETFPLDLGFRDLRKRRALCGILVFNDTDPKTREGE